MYIWTLLLILTNNVLLRKLISEMEMIIVLLRAFLNVTKINAYCGKHSVAVNYDYYHSSAFLI